MSGCDTSREIAYLRVEHGGRRSLLVAPVGETLRDALLANGISPYTAITERLNCGGRGLCGTCGVRFIEPETPSTAEGGDAECEGEPDPDHWHDALAARFGYPRLSCRIEVEGDLCLAIPEKTVWGSRHADDE